MATTFFVILDEFKNRWALQVQVSKAVQDTLAAEFEKQADEFLKYSERISGNDGERAVEIKDSKAVDFFPIYSLHDHSEVFKIKTFAIDDFILSAASKPDSLPHLTLNDDTIPRIKAFCAVSGTKAKPKICFQAFDRRRILQRQRFTFLQSGDSFSRLDKVGFTLGEEVQAVYDAGTLYFRSYTVVSRFVNLLGLFNEASNEKLRRYWNIKFFTLPIPNK